MDNVTIERPWRSPKYECVCLHAFETGSAARADIGRWIDVHNTERPHSALGGPIEAHQGPGLKAARSTGKLGSAANLSANRGPPHSSTLKIPASNAFFRNLPASCRGLRVQFSRRPSD